MFWGCWYSIPHGEEERVCPLCPGGFYNELEGRVVLCGEHVASVEVHSNTAPVPNNRWDKETLNAMELEEIRPFLKQIRAMKDQCNRTVQFIRAQV